MNFLSECPFSNLGYLILRPFVLMLVPVGSDILDNLDNINDFPLFIFPTIPILINS